MKLMKFSHTLTLILVCLILAAFLIFACNPAILFKQKYLMVFSVLSLQLLT